MQKVTGFGVHQVGRKQYIHIMVSSVNQKTIAKNCKMSIYTKTLKQMEIKTVG